MHHRHARNTAALVAIAALAVPAGAVAKGKLQGEKVKQRTVTYVLKGSVASIDAGAQSVVVKVARGNRHGRALVGRELTVTLAGAKVSVADTNRDGTAGVADVQSGDRVLVQVRLPRRGAVAGPVAARKLVDLTRPESEEDETEVGPAS